ncbi:MAG: cell envelope integrity protein TolA [Cytophagales bacterium]|nr:cell envelope integrity protein TolA [Cytophagales bacterium]
MTEKEKKNERTGLITSAGIHAALFLILFFIIAWRAPDPPLPEYGIELNFGLDDQGSGSVQPDKPVGDQGEKTTAESRLEESAPAEAQAENTDPAQHVDEQAVEPVSKVESPVTVVEKKKPVVTPEKKIAEAAPAKTVANEYKKDASKTATAAEAQKKGEIGSQGDDIGKTGDKGSPEGKLDATALYGTPGGGGGGTGMNLQMSGWAWADDPRTPDLPDNEPGKIVFEIECDEHGDIVGITTIERTISPRAEQMLRDAIRRNSLVRTSGGKVPDRSKGRIVIYLRTK